jgi:hypothetical protein
VWREQQNSKVRSLCSATIARLGGIDRAAQHWVDCFQAAKATNPGGRYALAFNLALLRLIEFSHEHAAPALGSGLTDEQLREQFLHQLQRIAAERPREFATVLEHLGWRVELPVPHDV